MRRTIATADRRALQESADAGVQLIGKPFSFGELGAKVRDLLDR